MVIRKQPDNSYGYELNVFITSKKYEANSQFKDDCAKCLEFPASIIKVKKIESMPYTSNGKISRKSLIAQIEK